MANLKKTETSEVRNESQKDSKCPRALRLQDALPFLLSVQTPAGELAGWRG